MNGKPTDHCAPHIMLDLEFMSRRPDAAIVQIGAVVFDPFGNPTIEIPEAHQFGINVAMESSIAGGGTVDGGTVMWWLEQAADARSNLASPKPVNINVALQAFSGWVRNRMDEMSNRVGLPADHEFGPFMWGNGAATDNVILRSAYERANWPLPWHFRHDRCYRTMIGFLDPNWNMPRQQRGTFHRATDDAISQAHHLQAVLRASGVRPLVGESASPPQIA